MAWKIIQFLSLKLGHQKHFREAIYGYCSQQIRFSREQANLCFNLLRLRQALRNLKI